LTVSAFIKKEEKKREKDRAANNTPKPAVAAAPEALVTASRADQPLDTSDQPFQSIENISGQQGAPNAPVTSTVDGDAAASEAPRDSTQALEQQMTEVSRLGPTLRSTFAYKYQTLKLSQPPEGRQGSTAQPPASNKSAERTSTGPENPSEELQAGVKSGQNAERQDPSEMWNMNGGQEQQMYPSAFGFNTSQGNFNNMNWNGATGFNPMMQMANGMNGGDWNNYSSMMGEHTLHENAFKRASS
jgi:hypothetical protein